MFRIFLFVLSVVTACTAAADGKLLATPGVTQFEGSGGGGIVPWAMLSGYATRDEFAASASATRVKVNDFGLDVVSATFNMRDRIELSFAHQDLAVLPLGLSIRQDVIGVKARIYGDIVYSRLPQVSVGLQHKRLDDGTVPALLGATDDSGTDVYLAASKLHLGAAFGYNLLWNATVRSTRANQTGFLGFGGDKDDGRSLEFEGAVAVLLNRHFAIGAEYRQKPDTLSAVVEDNWSDVFLAFFPSRHLNLTVAWADLGRIAGTDDQRGVYVSLTGYIK